MTTPPSRIGRLVATRERLWIAERGGEGYLRGWKLAGVKFRPVRYDASRGALHRTQGANWNRT